MACSAKADPVGFQRCARVGGHNDDGVFKVNHAPVAVREAPVVQDLQKHVVHVRVRFFNLIKEHHTVRFSTDLLGQLTTVVIADVAGRRTDELAHGMRLHEFGHVKAHQTVLSVKHNFSQGFY